MTDIAIYADKKLMPPVIDLLAGVLESYPQITGVSTWEDNTPPTTPVLVLGNMPEQVPGIYVKTISQKQLLSGASALTELRIALDRLLEPPVFEPLTYMVVDGLTDEEEAAIGDVIVVDIETGGNIDVDLPSEVWLLSLSINDGKNIYVFTEESLQESTVDNALAQILRILSKPGRKLVAHNMKFDFRILGHNLGQKIYGHLCTLILHHSINHGAKNHDLKTLAQRYLGAPEWEKDLKKYTVGGAHYENIPREILYEYNAYDVYWNWHLLQFLLRVSENDPRLVRVAQHSFLNSNMFQDIEETGIAVNVAYLDSLKQEYDIGEVEPLERIVELTWDGFNPGSWQQVKKFLESKGIKVKSTDEKTLMKLDLHPGSEAHEFRELLFEIRGIRKMRSTYVEGALKRRRGNIVYPTFKIHGTTTGRLSSSNPNIQNIPREKKLRKIYVPRAEGRTMVQVDYSQAELRVMACLSEDAYLISLFQKDSEDFFDALMPSAFPQANIAAWSAQEAKDNRAKLKAVVYGLAYNRKAQAIAVELNMPVREAQAIINNFFRAAPSFYEWRMWVTDTVLDEDAALISPFGRQYQAEVVTGRNKQNVINSGLAFLPQSTASDMCLVAARNVHKRLQTGEFGDTVITATIHDAILLDVPDEFIDKVKTMVVDEMEQAGIATFGTVVHFGAEASSGASWGEAD